MDIELDTDLDTETNQFHIGTELAGETRMDTDLVTNSV
jgi:hypothetical protein